LTSCACYRRRLPPAACPVVRVVSTRHEDCGPGVQMTVNAARQDGVPVSVLRAVIDSKPEDLPEDLADTYRFTAAVLRATYDEGDLRERIRGRWGDEALVEIALAI